MERLTLHGVQLRSRNFTGIEKEMNNKGDRNVLIVLSDEHARDLGFEDKTDMFNCLKADDWAIKRFNATEEHPDPDCFIKARPVYFDNEKSNIFLKTENGKSRLLTADSVGCLDGDIEILNVDVILNKHFYRKNGREGYNVRIKSMEVVIREDEISARNSIMDYEEELPFGPVSR